MKIMAEAMFKELLKTKLKMIHGVVQILPPQMKESVTDFERSILRVVHEVTQEYAAAQPAPAEGGKGLAAINIE